MFRPMIGAAADSRWPAPRSAGGQDGDARRPGPASRRSCPGTRRRPTFRHPPASARWPLYVVAYGASQPWADWRGYHVLGFGCVRKMRRASTLWEVAEVRYGSVTSFANVTATSALHPNSDRRADIDLCRPRANT